MIDETIDIISELTQNFVDSSYDTNCNRAFPDVRDGLKPGMRACIYEMWTRKYTSNKPHVKSAKISGAVCSDLWPHGTAAIYETFVRMSQPFTNNLPEVDFHGANGNIILGGDSYAADRYTEARLSKITEEGMLAGIDKNNVDMILNFSEDEYWPKVLPALFPRLLVNGTQGIGVSIANIFLPHNFQETTDVILNYIKSGEIDEDNYFPDFPTGGTIVNKDELSIINKTGKGKVVVEANYKISGKEINFYEMPYQVYIEPVIEEIKKAYEEDKLPGFKNISNRCDKNNISLLVECERNADPQKLVNALFENTSLRKQYNANQNGIISKTPVLLNLRQMIDVYIDHNTNCIKREHQFDYDKAIARIHILEGLLIALSNIEDVIEIIRHSANPSTELTNRFNLDDIQVKAILDMKLSRLSKLEEDKLIQEKEEKEDFAAKCKKVVESEDEQKNILVERLSNLAKKYGTPRRTQVIQKDIVKTIGSKKKTEEVVKDIVVAFNPIGYVQAIPVTQYRNNGFDSFKTTTKDLILLFSNQGRFFRISGKNIKECGPKDKGTAIGSIIKLNEGEKIINISSMDINDKRPYLLFTINNGMIKKIDKTEFIGTTRNLNGMMACKLKENSSVVSINETNGCIVTLVTKSNYVISFEAEDVRLVGRAAAGVKGINLGEDDKVVECIISDSNASKVKTTLGNLEIHVQKRGGKGKIVKK